MFQKFDLIKPYDNDEGYFDYQDKLLQNISNNAENALRLAILQTLAPVENYKSAICLLQYEQDIFDDKRISLIGFYLSIVWNGEPKKFINKMLSYSQKESNEYKSMVDYLLALQSLYKEQEDEMIAFLKKSIALYKFHVNNFLLLSQYSNKKDSKLYIKKARENIINMTDNETIEYFTDPNNFIGEFISGCLMPIETFEELIS